MNEPSPDTATTVAFGLRHLGADGGRQAVAHGAQPTGGEVLQGVVEAAVLGHPHLVLAHVTGTMVAPSSFIRLRSRNSFGA